MEANDLRSKLSVPLVKFNLHTMVSTMYDHTEDIKILFHLITDEDQKIAWKAAWVMEKIAKRTPDLVVEYRNDLYVILTKTKNGGIKRILLTTLYNLPSPLPLPVDFLDFCLERMLSFDESIAVQSLCIKHAYRLCLTEPDLMLELQLYLDNADREYYSIAVKNAIKNTLIKINKKLKLCK